MGCSKGFSPPPTTLTPVVTDGVPLVPTNIGWVLTSPFVAKTFITIMRKKTNKQTNKKELPINSAIARLGEVDLVPV